MSTEPPGRWWRGVYEDLRRVDDATYQAISATPTPTLDPWLRRLSRCADRSALWVAVAAGLAAFGGAGGRRAARDGLVSVAVTSGLVNRGPQASAQPPPARRHAGARRFPGAACACRGRRRFPPATPRPPSRLRPPPGRRYPPLALPLRLLATAVAYSRVHGGAHYPGDAIAGSAIGGAAAAVVVPRAAVRAERAARAAHRAGWSRPVSGASAAGDSPTAVGGSEDGEPLRHDLEAQRRLEQHRLTVDAGGHRGLRVDRERRRRPLEPARRSRVACPTASSANSAAASAALAISTTDDPELPGVEARPRAGAGEAVEPVRVVRDHDELGGLVRAARAVGEAQVERLWRRGPSRSGQHPLHRRQLRVAIRVRSHDLGIRPRARRC